MLSTRALDQSFEGRHVHVAFKGMLDARLASFRNHQISSLGADKFHISSGCIEMRVVGDNIAFLALTLNRMRSAARP